MLIKAGLPSLAYAVFLGEVVAPLFLLVGLYVVPAALVVAMNMLVALVLVHTNHFLQLSKSGGWALELPAFLGDGLGRCHGAQQEQIAPAASAAPGACMP